MKKKQKLILKNKKIQQQNYYWEMMKKMKKKKEPNKEHYFQNKFKIKIMKMTKIKKKQILSVKIPKIPICQKILF